ncbi:MAG: hypothetical protein IJN70_08185 [Clostridia bacterium]|nr:hypothetical protein [Clostridia bacterium]
MIFDNSLKNVIITAYENETDVFLRMNPPRPQELAYDNTGTAVFMPGGFPCNESSSFYDIRRLGDEAFRRELSENNVKRLIVLFAECADKAEYGYREAFGWIGEMRAEVTHFIQVVAFFSPASDSFGVCRELFGSGDVICIGEKELPEADAFCTASPKAKFYQTALLAEKYAFKKSAVYFNSREEARSFACFLQNRGTRCAYADGSLSHEELRENVKKFAEGNVNILVATKAAIPVLYFRPPEKAVFCGVPFSLSHLSRCAAFLENEKPFVIYCEEDIKRNKKIIASFSEKLSDGEISQLRTARLEEMVKMLNTKA